MLTVKFPISEWGGWDLPELVMSPKYLENTTQKLTVAVDSDHSDYGSDSPLFVGYVLGDSDQGSLSSSLPPGSDVPPIPIKKLALKFAFRGDFLAALEFESEVYRALLPLQGNTIPYSLGLFLAEKDDDQIGCLAIEYWGESLKTPFHSLPMESRLAILNSLFRIHKAGCKHGDVAERNVLMAGEDVRIIDFDEAEQHACECDISKVVGGNNPPQKENFGCDELYFLCERLRIWQGS